MENAKIVFDLWAKEVKDEGTNRFLYSGRIERLDDLVLRLKNCGCSFDDILLFKTKVSKTLVTKEGVKNNGKYKGWVNQVEEEFYGCTLDLFKGDLEKTLYKPNTASNAMLSDSLAIENWCKNKFGEFCSKKLIEEARTVGSIINSQMIRDFCGK